MKRSKKLIACFLAVIMVMGLVPITNFGVKTNAAGQGDLALNETVSVTMVDYYDRKIYYFTPSETATYRIDAKEPTSGKEAEITYFQIYDYDNYYMGRGYGHVDYILEANKRYKIEVSLSDYETENINLNLSVHKLVKATSIVTEKEIYRSVKGDYIKVNVKFLPEYSIKENLTNYATDKPEIAAFDDYGGANLLGSGETNATITSESGLTASCKIVVDAPPKLSLGTPETVTIDNNCVCFDFTPAERGTYMVYCDKQLTFGVRISIIEPNGYINNGESFWGDTTEPNDIRWAYTMEKDQTYTIKFTPEHEGQKGTFTFNTIKMVSPKGLTIIPETINGHPGENEYLGYEFSPFNSLNEEVTFTSDNTNVVTVERNYIEFVGVGTATITAVSKSGLRATCSVNVTDYPEIFVGDTKTYEVTDTENKNVKYKFTPEKDGQYIFYSSSSVVDTEGYIYNSYGRQQGYDDDSGGYYCCFKVKISLLKGQTYLLESIARDNNVGTVSLHLEEYTYITDISVNTNPTKMDYIRNVDRYFNANGLVLNLTWSNGKTTLWRYGTDDSYINDTQIRFESDSIMRDGIVYICYNNIRIPLQLNLIDTPVASLEVIKNTTNDYIENYGGNLVTKPTGESYYEYNGKDHSDAVIKVNYKDGSSKLTNPGKYLDGYEVKWSCDQDTKHWKLSNMNESTVTYMDVSVNLPITVKENPVRSVTLKEPVPNIVFYENLNGYHDSYKNPETGKYVDYFHYQLYNALTSDIKVNINFKNGQTKSASLNDFVDGYQVEYIDTQSKKPWSLGVNNTVDITYLGVVAKLPVTVAANPVESITIDKAPTREYIINDITYAQETYNGLMFNPWDLTGIEFTINKTDRTKEKVTYADLDKFKNPDGYISYSYNNLPIEIHTYDNMYTVGSHKVQLMYMNKTVFYNVNVVESGVQSIEILKNPEQTVCDQYHFPNLKGLSVRVNYTNGTSETITATDTNVKYKGSQYQDTPYGEMTLSDGKTLFVKREWLKEQSQSGGDEAFVLTCYDKSVIIDGITIDNNSPRVENMTGVNPSLNGSGMTLILNYSDKTVEFISFDNCIFEIMGEMSRLIAKTPKGYVLVNARERREDDGQTIFFIRACGCGCNIGVNSEKGDFTSDGVIDNSDYQFMVNVCLNENTNLDVITKFDFNNDNVLDILDVYAMHKLVNEL